MQSNLEIARRLEIFNAVLVQGPPGTGKTHTIANLLGHLLAQGKSVLVTSHTPKALRVLREKVVEPLQPLCVSLLEDDSRKQMESTIDAITERLSSLDERRLAREVGALHNNAMTSCINFVKWLMNSKKHVVMNIAQFYCQERSIFLQNMPHLMLHDMSQCLRES